MNQHPIEKINPNLKIKPYTNPDGAPPEHAVFTQGSIVSLPRTDGAVQSVDWNNYLKNKGSLVPKWANRWMFLQDTMKLPNLTAVQKLNNNYNFGNVRMMIGMMMSTQVQMLSALGWAWLPYDESKGDNNRTAILDAMSFADDTVVAKGIYAGQISVGTWAKDIAGLIPIWEQHGFWMNANPPSTPFPVPSSKT